MKIALVAPESLVIPPDVAGGGIEWLVYDLARGLEKLGKDVTVVARIGSTYEGKLKTVDIFHPGEKALENYVHNMNLDEFDVVHDHMTGTSKRIYPVERILTTLHWRHSGLSCDFYNVVVQTPDQRKWTIEQWKTYFYNLLKDDNVPEGVSGKGVITDCPVVYPGLDEERFHIGNDDYILYLGQFREWKGVDIAIEVAKRMPEERFIFAGFGDEWLPKIKEAMLVNPKIEVIMYPKGKEKDAIFSNAKLFLFPLGGFARSTPDSFAITQIEAWLSGVPVIATNYGAEPELIEENVNGNICNTVDDFITAIKNANFDREEVRNFGLEYFSKMAMAKNYFKLYEKLYEND